MASAFDQIVVKTGEKGQKVLLRDVGKVELGTMMPNELTTFDGKPAALLAVFAKRDASFERIERTLALLKKTSPKGAEFTTVVTPTTPRVLRLEVHVSDSNTMEYTQAVCERVIKIALAWNGGIQASSFTDKLQSDRAAVLVTCKPDADLAVLRKRLAREVREAAIRICDVTGGKPAFPVRIALAGPDSEHLRKWSEAILSRAGKDGIVSDVADWPGRDVKRHELIINNDKARELGIDLHKALVGLSEINAFRGKKPEELDNLFVKDAKGAMVPFSAFASMKHHVDSVSIYRLGLERAMRITANPADGKSVADSPRNFEPWPRARKRVSS